VATAGLCYLGTLPSKCELKSRLLHACSGRTTFRGNIVHRDSCTSSYYRCAVVTTIKCWAICRRQRSAIVPTYAVSIPSHRRHRCSRYSYASTVLTIRAYVHFTGFRSIRTRRKGWKSDRHRQGSRSQLRFLSSHNIMRCRRVGEGHNDRPRFHVTTVNVIMSEPRDRAD
jgi:hypothetical protein